MIFKTKPYKHQHDIWNDSKDRVFYALFMEMGTGKSKVIIDTASFLYRSGHITGVVILAPNGVHTNWVVNEIPAHSLVENVSIHWKSTAKVKEEKRLLEIINEPPKDALVYFCLNIEAIRTKKGYNAVETFLKRYKTMMVIDESTSIKNPRAIQTRNATKLGKKAPFRRLLTGTPITQAPLDLYSQCEFLEPGCIGFKSYYAFKGMYAQEITITRKDGRSYPQITGYKNLDQLTETIKDFSVRVMKEDCLDLPEKIYTTQYVELTDEQRKLYDDMRDMALIEMKSGDIVSAKSTLVVIGKLQQIIGGFIKNGEGEILSISNNRVEALVETLRNIRGKSIIWCKFIAEINKCRSAIADEFGSDSVVSYCGSTKVEERTSFVRRLQEDPECRFFVATSAASKGLTLTAANTVIYYSNDYNLETRLQSEDRCHRIGQKNNVTYIDLMAKGTVDEKILQVLKNKQELAGLVLDDLIKVIT